MHTVVCDINVLRSVDHYVQTSINMYFHSVIIELSS